MKLHENLQLCLLALASRYPDDTVEINEAIFDILDLHSFTVGGLTPSEMIEVLLRTNPHLLQTEACVVVSAQESTIYLLDCSEKIPAFWIHRPAPYYCMQSVEYLVRC